jgi:hypothetical protein
VEWDRAGKNPADFVLEFYAAVRDARVSDVLRLVDPDVVCRPLVLPGPSLYCGRDSMVSLVENMHAAYGDYMVEADVVVEAIGPVVSVQARLVPEPARALAPLSITTVFRFRYGLIASIESEPGPSLS